MSGNREVLRLKKMADVATDLRWQAALKPTPKGFAAFCQYFVSITTDEPGVRLRFRWNEVQRAYCALWLAWAVVLKARQVGFTTLELCRDLWFALTRPGVAVAVIVPPHKEALPRRRVIAQLREMVRRLGQAVAPALNEGWSGATLRLANGSTLTVFDAGGSADAAAKMGRGGTYHRVHLTELAHFPYADALLEALVAAVPRPERGGEFVIESTPRGVGGAYYAFWQAAKAGTNGFTPCFFPWYWLNRYRHGRDERPAVPGTADEREVVACALADGFTLSISQLGWWRQQVATLGLRRVLQEYPHSATRCFLLAGESYFDADALGRLDDALVASHLAQELAQQAARPGAAQFHRQRLAVLAQSLNRGGLEVLRVWDGPAPGHAYVVAVDCAGGGVQGDWLVAVVLDRAPRLFTPQGGGPARPVYDHAATLRARVSPAEFARWVHLLATAYGGALVCVERNGHGGTALHVLDQELEYPHLWRDAKLQLGWYTGVHNRLPAIDDLADALHRGELHSRDSDFATEARTFVVTKDGKVAADKGCTDDVVMALAIGWAVLHGPRSGLHGPRAGVIPQAAP